MLRGYHGCHAYNYCIHSYNISGRKVTTISCYEDVTVVMHIVTVYIVIIKAEEKLLQYHVTWISRLSCI